MELDLQVHCRYFQACAKESCLIANMAKIGQYVGFRLFPFKIISTGFRQNLIFKHIGAIFPDVSKASEAYIFGPPNEPNLMFLSILLKRFLWIHLILTLYAHCRYFQRCVKYGPQSLKCFGPFWTPK